MRDRQRAPGGSLSSECQDRRAERWKFGNAHDRTKSRARPVETATSSQRLPPRAYSKCRAETSTPRVNQVCFADRDHSASCRGSAAIGSRRMALGAVDRRLARRVGGGAQVSTAAGSIRALMLHHCRLMSSPREYPVIPSRGN